MNNPENKKVEPILTTNGSFDVVKLLDEQADTIKSFRNAFEELIHLRIENEINLKNENKDMRAENRKLRKELEKVSALSLDHEADLDRILKTIPTLQEELDELRGSGE